VPEGKLDVQVANANGITTLSGLGTYGNEDMFYANLVGSTTANMPGSLARPFDSCDLQ
jgi:hypothetical protein